MNLKERLHTLVQQLGQGLYEKEDLLALGLLAAVSGESLFLLGPPGVAKSMVARRLRLAFRDEARSFEYLLNRFSTPDEIFGPVSITGLKQDNYQRCTEGYLPDAHVVFLDEIWKASPSILNTLLTMLNEHVFRNGKETIQLPLRLLLAASNELPAEGEGLEALWDRFLLRRSVSGIQSLEQFDAMLLDASSEQEPHINSELQISLEELTRWKDAILSVKVSQSVLLAIHVVKRFLQSPDVHSTAGSGIPLGAIYVSDRRWRKAMHLMRTCAFLNNSDAVHLSDVILLSDILWNESSQEPDIHRMLVQAITSAITTDLDIELHQERLDAMRDELKSVRNYGVTAESNQHPLRVHSFYHQISHPQSRPILIFINEYEELCNAGESMPFILQTDTKKLGAQVLKKYERSRYPGVFAKDILHVTHVPGGIRINGKDYPLVLETKDAISSQNPASNASDREVKPEFQEALRRIHAQIAEVKVTYEHFCSEEVGYLQNHLILTPVQKNLMQQALEAVNYAITRLSGDAAELCHTFHISL